MGLKTKILFYYFAISLIALFAFGFNAYRIAHDTTEHIEESLILQNAKIRAHDLSLLIDANGDRRRLVDYISTAPFNENELVIVTRKDGLPIHEINASPTVAKFFEGWRNSDQSENFGDVVIDKTTYHWTTASLGSGGDILISAIRSPGDDAATAKRLSVRLLAVGGIILWISVWVILIFATAVTKKLDEQTKALEFEANHDALTSLPNRSRLLQLLTTAVAHARTNNQSVVLIVIDLDRFKEINDTLGQIIGDAVLQHVATRLLSVKWHQDTVARLGGDKFGCLLPVADRTHCRVVLEKIFKAMSEPFAVNEIQIDVGITAGIAIYPDDSTNPMELLSHAEVAMYESKRHHEPYTYYNPSFDPHSMDRLQLVADLKHATAKNELLLYYQPLIDVKTKQVIGAEALARWQNEQRGLVMPDKFIPLAEQTGIIKPMTYYIINQAVEQCARWQKSGMKINVSVNLSAKLVHDRALPTIVEDALRKHNLEPSLLELEITESSVMLDPTTAIEVLNRLDEMGVYLLIDDFGSGYTSLSYLKKLPVDAVKIDRSFVMNMMRDPNDALVVHSIIDLAHNMSRTVVAEGVENEAILDELTGLSCDVAQGFYFSKPLPVNTFETWYKQYNKQLLIPKSKVGRSS